MKKLVVKKDTLAIVGSFETEIGGEWSVQEIYAHIELPEGVPHDLAKAEMVDDEIVIVVDEDRAMDRIRAMRNAKLAACDWTQIADSPLSSEEKAAWAAYRQELRDLPENTEDLVDPTWPEHP